MFKSYGLYSHIRANQLRTVFLLTGFIVLLFALMFSVALVFEVLNSDPGSALEWIISQAFEDLKNSWSIGVVAALIWFCIAYLFHQKMIDFATGAASLSREQSPRLYNILENLCISRGIPIPALQIIETDALNAYASGLKEGQYKIAVTQGLLNELTDAEIASVLAHELTHIRNKDVQLMVVAVIFAGVFAFFADLTIRRWDFPFGFSPYRQQTNDERRKDGGASLAVVIALAIIALSWGASLLIRFAISRSREYLADAGSVELTKDPDSMISALRKIEAHGAIPTMPSRMHAFFVESPAIHPDSGWLASHPSVDERVEALMRFAGGHDLTLTKKKAGPWG